MFVHDIVPAKVVPRQEVLPVLDMLVRLNKVSIAESQVDAKTGQTRYNTLKASIPWSRVQDITDPAAQPIAVP